MGPTTVTTQYITWPTSTSTTVFQISHKHSSQVPNHIHPQSKKKPTLYFPNVSHKTQSKSIWSGGPRSISLPKYGHSGSNTTWLAYCFVGHKEKQYYTHKI